MKKYQKIINQNEKISALIDIYQEIKDIFNKQNNKLKIKNLDDYIEQLKEKILKIEFGQNNLTQKVKSSLDNYFKNPEEIKLEMIEEQKMKKKNYE